jgi:FKBP-type peptidyl-prolyl cis-trans isomerase 2
MKKIQVGDTVIVNYTGRLEDGTIFDSSLNEGREPLTSTLGQGQLISGFEDGLIDMVVGETKTIEIAPENAYGNYQSEMITIVSKSQVPETIQVGETLQGNTPNGPIIVKVIEVTDDSVTLDANHPLAGKKLIFDLEVMGIS